VPSPCRARLQFMTGSCKLIMSEPKLSATGHMSVCDIHPHGTEAHALTPSLTASSTNAHTPSPPAHPSTPQRHAQLGQHKRAGALPCPLTSPGHTTTEAHSGQTCITTTQYCMTTCTYRPTYNTLPTTQHSIYTVPSNQLPNGNFKPETLADSLSTGAGEQCGAAALTQLPRHKL
jgi:hypothetical protein